MPLLGTHQVPRFRIVRLPTICSARDDRVIYHRELFASGENSAHCARVDVPDTIPLLDLPTLGSFARSAIPSLSYSIASTASRDQSSLQHRRTIRTTPADGICIVY